MSAWWGAGKGVLIGHDTSERGATMNEDSQSDSFSYEQCDIPEGLTIAQWRTMRVARRPRRSWSLFGKAWRPW